MRRGLIVAPPPTWSRCRPIGMPRRSSRLDVHDRSAPLGGLARDVSRDECGAGIDGRVLDSGVQDPRGSRHRGPPGQCAARANVPGENELKESGEPDFHQFDPLLGWLRQLRRSACGIGLGARACDTARRPSNHLAQTGVLDSLPSVVPSDSGVCGAAIGGRLCRSHRVAERCSSDRKRSRDRRAHRPLPA